MFRKAPGSVPILTSVMAENCLKSNRIRSQMPQPWLHHRTPVDIQITDHWKLNPMATEESINQAVAKFESLR